MEWRKGEIVCSAPDSQVSVEPSSCDTLIPSACLPVICHRLFILFYFIYFISYLFINLFLSFFVCLPALLSVCLPACHTACRIPIHLIDFHSRGSLAASSWAVCARCVWSRRPRAVDSWYDTWGTPTALCCYCWRSYWAQIGRRLDVCMYVCICVCMYKWHWATCRCPPP